jgi:hypothetical protein
MQQKIVSKLDNWPILTMPLALWCTVDTASRLNNGYGVAQQVVA